MLILLSLIIVSCKTTKVEYQIVLPPRPKMPIMNENPTSVADMAEIINQYNSLVKEWELYGDKVEKLVNGDKNKK